MEQKLSDKCMERKYFLKMPISTEWKLYTYIGNLFHLAQTLKRQSKFYSDEGLYARAKYWYLLYLIYFKILAYCIVIILLCSLTSLIFLLIARFIELQWTAYPVFFLLTQINIIFG